jgi:hypothetical protein
MYRKTNFNLQVFHSSLKFCVLVIFNNKMMKQPVIERPITREHIPLFTYMLPLHSINYVCREIVYFQHYS